MKSIAILTRGEPRRGPGIFLSPPLLLPPCSEPPLRHQAPLRLQLRLLRHSSGRASQPRGRTRGSFLPRVRLLVHLSSCSTSQRHAVRYWRHALRGDRPGISPFVLSLFLSPSPRDRRTSHATSSSSRTRPHQQWQDSKLATRLWPRSQRANTIAPPTPSTPRRASLLRTKSRCTTTRTPLSISQTTTRPRRRSLRSAACLNASSLLRS